MNRLAIAPFSSEIKPSRLWLIWVVLTHLFLLFAVVYYRTELIYLVLLFPISLYFALTPVGYFFSKRPEIEQIKVNTSGEIILVFSCVGAQKAELCSDSFVCNWLVVLNLKVNNTRRSVMLLPDSADSEFLRELRVYLRWFPELDAQKTSLLKKSKN